MQYGLISLLAAIFCLSGCARLDSSDQSATTAEPRERANTSIQGISPWQVFARKGDSADIPFAVLTSGTLSAQVIRDSDGKVVTRQKWEVSPGAFRNGPPTLAVRKVPVGGEYTIRFTQHRRTDVFDHILVGDIWVIGGQSNAVGPLAPIAKPNPGVHYYKGKWQEGAGMLFPTFSKDPPGHAPFSAWRPAANEYYKRTGVPVGLMGWAFGGVPMSHFWDKKIKEMPNFKEMVSQHGRGATTYLYYQGEMDCTPELLPVYQDRLKSMASVIRRYAGNPGLTMVVVQLAYVADRNIPAHATPYCGRLREAQRQFCLADPKAVLIPAIPYPHFDTVHLSVEGQKALGKTIGDCLVVIDKTGKTVWQGPRVVKAQFTDKTRRAVRVTFDSAKKVRVLEDPLGIEGSNDTTWCAGHRPEMDWLITDDKKPGHPEAVEMKPDPKATQWSVRTVRVPYTKLYAQPKRVAAEGREVVLELSKPASVGARISYGLMSSSLCTLTDEKGRAAATFDAIPVEETEKEMSR